MSRCAYHKAGQPALTADQFACCTTGASGKSSEAARLVLVMGESEQEAARLTGLAVQSVRNALVRIRKRDAQIRAAYLSLGAM